MILKKKSVKHYIYIAFLLAFILGRGSALSICGQNLVTYAMALLMCLVVYLILSEKGKISTKKYKSNQYPWIFVILLIPSVIANSRGGGFATNSHILVLLVLTGLLTSELDKRSLMEQYLNLMLFLAIVSLVGYFIFVILGAPVEIMPRFVKTQEASVVYRSIGIYGIWLSNFERNCGPFWEPSIFAAYLSFALVIRLFFLSERKKKVEIVLLVITMITTMSSGGILLLLIIGAMWLFNKRKYGWFWTAISIVTIVLLTVFWDYICNFLLSVNYYVFSKIVDFRSSKSAMSRVYSILTNIEIWKNHFFLGCGYTALDGMYTDVARILIPAIYELSPSQSSTPLMFLAAYGVAGFYYSYLWIKAVVKTDIFNFVQKILFGFLIFFILNQTPHITFMTTYYLLFTFIKKDSNYNN